MTVWTRVFVAAVSGVLVVGMAGCKSSAAGGGSASGAAGTELSGPAVANADYAVRMPRKCAAVTSVPSAEQARELVQCHYEGVFDGVLWLATDVQVEMGEPRDASVTDVNSDRIDTTAKVYPITGSATGWTCALARLRTPGQNCQKFPGAPGAQGSCWKTKGTGAWACSMGIGGVGSNAVPNVAGPTGY